MHTSDFPFEELELRPLGVARGERRQRDPCLKSTYKNNNRVGRRQPMTSLPARLVAAGASLPVRPQYKRTLVEQDGLFFVFTDSLSGVCSKTVRDLFSWKTMASTSKAFRKCADLCPRYLTPDDTHDLCVFCLGEEHARDVLEGAVCVHFAGEDELLADDDVVSLTSSDPAASALLGPSQEEQDMLEGEEAEAEPSLISCPAYEELLEVMDRATRIHNFPHSNYANIEGMREHGYQKMPPVEETLASYLSVGKASSLKTPSLPSIPLQVTSRLNGRAYAAAGQAVGALHTMAVLQAYQADLLKDLDKGQGLSPDEVAELRRTTDLALRATKQAATAMGRSMGAMVVTERHLWVNLADLGKKERGFLLDAPVSPSELFGTSVETVVEKFREARARSAAFKTFIPRRSRSEPEQYGGPGPSRSEGRRQAQKTSVATRAPPPPAGGSGRKRGSRGGRQDLREVIQTRQRARRDQ
ncbi:hypothetical protein M9458_056936, partial [Cirrhinus mrigala]